MVEEIKTLKYIYIQIVIKKEVIFAINQLRNEKTVDIKLE